MTTLQLTSEIHIDINDLIGGIPQLDTLEIERLLSETSMILAQRKVSNLPARESYLLQKIGEGLSDDVQNRYDELQKKLLAEQLSPDEHQELLNLIDVVENADAERLKHLIELAQLRRLSLDELIRQLGIHPPPAYVQTAHLH